MSMYSVFFATPSILISNVPNRFEFWVLVIGICLPSLEASADPPKPLAKADLGFRISDLDFP